MQLILQLAAADADHYKTARLLARLAALRRPQPPVRANVPTNKCVAKRP